LVNQHQLANGDESERSPRQPFTDPKLALPSAPEPELELSCPKFHDVTVAQNGPLTWARIHVRDGALKHAQDEPFLGMERQFHVPIPHTWLFQPKLRSSRAANDAGKSSDFLSGLGAVGGENVQLDHS
jgi:hypothetical protein